MKTPNKSFRVLVVLALVLALLYPAIELVDVWDAPGNVLRTGSDTELDILLFLSLFLFLVSLARLILVVLAAEGILSGSLERVIQISVCEPASPVASSSGFRPLRI